MLSCASTGNLANAVAAAAANAGLRSKLTDRSAEGLRSIAKLVRADLDRVNALNTGALSHAMRTSVDVVKQRAHRAYQSLKSALNSAGWSEYGNPV